MKIMLMKKNNRIQDVNSLFILIDIKLNILAVSSITKECW